MVGEWVRWGWREYRKRKIGFVIAAALEMKRQHLRGLWRHCVLGGARVLGFEIPASPQTRAPSVSRKCYRVPFSWDWKPGVARRQLTFLASPRKVSQRRRPQVRRPDDEAVGVPFGIRCIGFRFSRREAMLREIPASPHKRGPLRNSGSKLCRARGFVLCSPSDSPRGPLPRLLRCSATLMGTLCRYATTANKRFVALDSVRDDSAQQ